MQVNAWSTCDKRTMLASFSGPRGTWPKPYCNYYIHYMKGYGLNLLCNHCHFSHLAAGFASLHESSHYTISTQLMRCVHVTGQGLAGRLHYHITFYKLHYLCTKFVVPSMGSIIQVGSSVRSYPPSSAADSSPMKLVGGKKPYGCGITL